MALVSVDGKLTGTDGGLPVFGSERDRARLLESRARADAVILGAGTVRQEDLAPRVSDAQAKARITAGRSAQPAVVVVSRSLDLPLDGAVLGDGSAPRYIATTATASVEAKKRAEAAGIRIIVAGDKDVDPARVLQALAADGHNDVVVEGGGGINAAFLQAGVVDELYVTIAPALLGGAHAPTLMTGPGLAQDDRIRLDLVEATAQPTGEIFVRYRVPAHHGRR